jgi:type VI secretion system secreted protein Hcp
MAFDTFVKIEGIAGESTDDKHKDWIELLSFSHGMSQPVSGSASTAGGASAERVDIQDFVITKILDKASPKLYEHCCSGKHVPSVVVEMCRAGGDKMKYMEIKMEDVLISSASPSGASGGDFPSESISFNFGKIKWTYTQQKRADGGGGGNVTGGWDLEKNARWA